MRYVATAYALDSRPERPAKPKKDDEKPKGGYRTKSGHKKLGKSAVLDAPSFGAAIEAAAKLVASLSDEAQASVVRVQVTLDSTDPSSGAVNPFGA
jgi:hypothetical protein